MAKYLKCCPYDKVGLYIICLRFASTYAQQVELEGFLGQGQEVSLEAQVNLLFIVKIGIQKTSFF